MQLSASELLSELFRVSQSEIFPIDWTTVVFVVSLMKKGAEKWTILLIECKDTFLDNF